jgi:mono/diheme cytochrome c family protein
MSPRPTCLRAVLTVALLAAGCGSARRGEPLAGPLRVADDADPAQVRHGEALFGRWCFKCHPGGEAGLGPALNDKPLPTFLMRLQVRQGLGVMPAFSDGQIADAELDALMQYVVALRRHGD